MSDQNSEGTQQRAEEVVDRVGRFLRRAAERVREEVEDIVAEAQDVRSGQGSPSAPDSA